MTIETHDAADVIVRLRAEIDRLEDFESECRMWRRRAREAIATVRPHINSPHFKEVYDTLVKTNGDALLRRELLQIFNEMASELATMRAEAYSREWQKYAHSEES
jgi:hypothetical protein